MGVYASVKKKTNNYFLEMSDVKKSDWFLLGGILLVCCFFFCQRFDLSITIKHSITMIECFLKGRPQHFYGDVYEKAISGYYGSADAVNSANYTFLLYFVLAIVNLPLFMIEKLLGASISMHIYILWNKAFILLVTLGTSYIIKKIGLKLNMSEERSKWMAFAFLSSPILLLGSTSFGQLDIFSIFFVCLAMLEYFDKKYYKFCIYMAIAIELKVFAILVLAVLIILVEKRLFQIIKYMLCGISIWLIDTLIFSFSGGKKLTSMAMSVYGFKDRIFQYGFNSFNFVSFLIVGLIIVIVLAYKKDIKSDTEHIVYGILFPLAMYTIFFGFVYWHPQWLCIMVPFITLAVFSLPNFKLSMYIEIALGASYIILTNLMWTNNVDADMINHGLLAALTNFTTSSAEPTVHTLIFVVKTGLPVSFYSSVLFAALMMNLFVKIPSHQQELILADDTSEPVSRGFMWSRMATIFIFIIPTFINYLSQWINS